ncbi:GNAT family acetyltransferase [Ceratobasidium sp. AG-Ba]|nr:GNAT family acetyltransferase [Ceratobasidium sp. AG-Ba]
MGSPFTANTLSPPTQPLAGPSVQHPSMFMVTPSNTNHISQQERMVNVGMWAAASQEENTGNESDSGSEHDSDEEFMDVSSDGDTDIESVTDVYNLDVWTETYSISFYLSYLSKWPELCAAEVSPSGRMMGYVIGKAEGVGIEWHGHVTAITVAPEYRRLSVARKMMDYLEAVSDKLHNGYFVDLYVRCSNHVAINMYEGMGYSVYRRVKEYYVVQLPDNPDDEDAFDMRKPLSRDTGRRSVRAGGREIFVSRDSVS